MKNIVNSYVRRFRKERRRSRRAISILLALALLVSMGVTWQLHSTGIAMTNETFCGQEEHTHTEECYGTVLSCGLAESEATEGHTHTEDCYETVTVLVCGLEESEAHTHSEDCYSDVLTCGQEESQGHTHSEACYDEDGNLICGQEESEGHTHTADCYTSELTCGLEESEGHTHSDECYETQTVLVCGLEECEATEGHTHTEDCYETQLICGLEEHTHTVECLIDETADVETAADWEATIPDLTGVWAEDVVAIAESQLGYTESTANYTLADDGETHKGYTRYGAWYGNKYGDWCAIFASFCLHYAGVPESEFPEASGVYAWIASLNNMGLYAEDCTPSAGDLVFFDNDDDGAADHVGIVTEYDEDANKITVIEGNYSDAVAENTYSLSDSAITGFGLLPEQETEEAAETETYTAEADGVTVTVTAPVGALPENAELTVTMLAEDSDEYAAAAEAVGYDAEDEDTGMAALDITFYVDGEEVEPTQPVTVTIDASAIVPEEADAETIEVNHLAETEDGVEPVLVADATENTEGTVDAETVVAEFEVDGFSTFTIQWSGNNGAYFTITVHHVDESGEELSASTSNVSVNNNGGTYTFSDYAATISGYAYSKATYSAYNGSEVATATFTSTQSGGQGGGTTTRTLTLYNSDGKSVDTATYNNSTVSINVYLVYEAAATVNVSIVKAADGSSLSTTTANLLKDETTTLSSLASSAYSNSSYTYSYAIITYTDSDNNTATVENATSIVWNSDGTYTITDSSGTTYTATAVSSVVLVYVSNPSVTLSAAESSTEGVDYDLTATASNFSETATYTWSISDDESATLTPSDDGTTATFAWAEDADEGAVVTVTVTATYTYTDVYGNEVTETATDTYTLINGGSKSQTATTNGTELTIYFVDFDGNVILDATTTTSLSSVSGITSSNSDTDGVTAADLAALYTVSSDDTSVNYIYFKAYTDYSMTTEIYSIYYNTTDGKWYYMVGDNGNASGSWIVLDPATIYLYYFNNYTGNQLATSTSSYYYFHIDVRISGTINVTVTATNDSGFDVTVTKIWKGDESSDRPESITVYLTDSEGNKLTYIDEDGETQYYTAKLTAGNNWAYTWEDVELKAGTYGVTEDEVTGYEMTNSTTFTIESNGTTSTSTKTYSGTLTLTELSSVYITKKDDESTIYVSMRPGTTADDNGDGNSDYEFQSVYGHNGFTYENGKGYYPFDLVDGDTITVVVSFTYTYTVDGVTYTGTVTDMEITTEVSQANNKCNELSTNGGSVTYGSTSSGFDRLGFDVELDASTLLADYITTGVGASITNTLSENEEETTTSLTIIKLEEGTDTTYLAGAEFILYYKATEITINDSGEEVETEVTYYYSYNSEKGEYYWGTDRDSAYKITSVNNATGVTVSDLTVGTTYYLEEITAPDGYNLLSEPIEFELDEYGLTLYLVNDEASVGYDEDDNTILYVFNSKGYELPSTGGMGTWLYTLAGVILCGGAALVLYRRKRLS
ncbi:MAG: CHAP domain-containing protein [Oscillospiraceae bacterium]|nr:CHAP domain-containing protein [Oscillospiraceae bacterium]